MISVDPQKYKLPKRINLVMGPVGLLIVINRKSRLIMTDGKRILKITNQIKDVDPNVNIGVLTNAPVCSKTRKFLMKNKICITEN